MARHPDNEKYILAIDHGTSGCKTAIFSARGAIVDWEYEKTPIYFFDGGGAEQDPGDWWSALVNTSRKLVEKKTIPADSIAAVCCSSTFSSTVAVDAGGNHLSNSLTWMDSRGAPYVREIARGIINIEGYGVSKLLRWIPKTGGGPTLSGKDDIAHVLYWKNARPDIYEKARMFLGSKDYLNFRLTGKFAASYDSIMLFWVTDTRDIDNIRYDNRLIDMAGIDRNKLPDLKRSTDILGTIRREVADAIGLRRDVKVVAGAADLQSACVGSGAVRDYEGHVYVGTSSWVLCHVPFKKTDLFHIIASLPSAIPGKYFCANEQDVAGGCLDFLIENILYHKNDLRSETPPEDIYEKLDAIAQTVPAGSNGVIFTPWLNGEKTPVDDANLRTGFLNVSIRNNLDDMIRSVMEGVALNSLWALKYVEKFIGRKMGVLNIIGGGAKSDEWCKIYADVLNRPIRRVKAPIQANGRGAAFIASVALGFISFDDIPDLIEYDNIFEPNPENAKLYDELFEEYVRIYKNNRKMYARLNGKNRR